MNASEQISPETATFERFLEFARPGGQFHPNFCSLIEQSLYNDPFNEEQLQILAKKGEHGTLVAIVLAFAYGRFPDPEWAIAVLGVKPPGAMQNEPCLRSILDPLGERPLRSEGRPYVASLLPGETEGGDQALTGASL